LRDVVVTEIVVPEAMVPEAIVLLPEAMAVRDELVVMLGAVTMGGSVSARRRAGLRDPVVEAISVL